MTDHMKERIEAAAKALWFRNNHYKIKKNHPDSLWITAPKNVRNSYIDQATIAIKAADAVLPAGDAALLATRPDVNQRLLDALKFYAAEDTWEVKESYDPLEYNIWLDNGDIARAAIAEHEQQKVM